MPSGQTFRLRRHQWAQFEPTDPNGLGLLLVDRDPTVTQTRTRPQVRDARAAFKQWPVYGRDVNALQSADQDVTLVPLPTLGAAPYLIRKGRPWQQQFQPTDPSSLETADQDVRLLPVSRPWWRLLLDARWRQPDYYDSSNYSSGLPDQDVNLIPWSQTTATYQRWTGQAQQSQWPALSRDVVPLQSADQDVTLRPPPWQWYRLLLDARWRQPKYNDYSQFAPTLPDQDVNLIPWTQTTATYQRWTGQAQQSQWPVFARDVVPLLSVDQDVTLRPVPWQWYRLPLDAHYRQPQYDDYSQFAPTLPDQDVNLVPWTPTVATYQRWTGQAQQSQWPVMARDVVPLLSADQPLLDLVPWRQTTAAFLRWQGRPWNEFPVLPRDVTVFFLPDQDVNLVPLPTRPQVRDARAQTKQWPVYSRLDATGLGLPDLLSPLIVPITSPPAARWRYTGRHHFRITVFTVGLGIPPAPVLESALSSWATVDGRTVAFAVIDGRTVAVLMLDGRTVAFATVDGRTITVPIVDGRTRSDEA